MNGVEINTRAYVATRLLLRWDYLYAVTLKTKVFGDYNHARLEVIIYYKPRPRNYRVLHRALYNPRPQAEGCMRGVKPDNFEAEACNIFKFFDYSLPSLKPSQRLSFEEERPVENKSRSLALLLQLGRRL